MAPGPGWVASPPLPGDGSREEERPWRPASLSKWPSLPSRWARPSGWARECGARWPAQHIRPGRSPSPSPGCSRFIRPLPGCSQRGGGLAGGRARLPGSCLLLPPPSGSDIIPLSPRRSRSAERGFWEAGEGWRARRSVAGRTGAGVWGRGRPGLPVACRGRGADRAAGFGWKGRGGRGGRRWDAVGGGRAGEDGAANSWDGSRQPLLDARWPPEGEEPRGAGPGGVPHTHTCETTARSLQVQQPLSASQTPAEEGEGCPRGAGRRGLPCREPRTSRFQGYTQ